jgi:hypothetical protein
VEWPVELADSDGQVEQFFEVLALGGVAAALPAWRVPMERFLEDWSLILALAEVNPELRGTAQFLLDALDVDESHPVHRLLVEYAAEVPDLATVRLGVEGGIAAARAQRWGEGFLGWKRKIQDGLIRVSEKVSAWLETQTGPVAVYAASGNQPQLRERLPIHASPEVCLLRLGDDLVLEIDGLEHPTPTLNGQELVALPPLEAGTRLYRLPPTPGRLLLGETSLEL